MSQIIYKIKLYIFIFCNFFNMINYLYLYVGNFISFNKLKLEVINLLSLLAFSTA